MSSRTRTLPPLVPPRLRLFDVLLLLVVTLSLTVSPFLLDLYGWHYGSPGGSPIEKVHPATWVLFLTFFLSAAARANPLSAFVRAAHVHPAVMVYLAAVVILMLQALFVLRLPFTNYIDTFLAPAIAFLLLHQVPDGRGRRLAIAIHYLFLINSLVGIAEFLFDFRVTPFVIEGVEFAAEWRSSALLGHPLSNALLTGSYVLALALGGGRDLPHLMRLVMFIVTALSMVVFGGRAATLILVVLLAAIALLKFFRVLGGRRFDLRSVWFLLAAVPITVAGFMFFLDVGFFDRFLSRVADDEGSAGTRLAMFKLFQHLSWYDLVFGPDPGHLNTYTTIYGLHLGIESFWIAMIMVNGMLVAIPFYIILGVFCWKVAKAAQTGPALWLFAGFFAVASASLSLSAKTPDFTIFIIMILVLFRRPLTGGEGVVADGARGGAVYQGV